MAYLPELAELITDPVMLEALIRDLRKAQASGTADRARNAVLLAAAQREHNIAVNGGRRGVILARQDDVASETAQQAASEWITTQDAADWYGMTAEYWRQLGKAGKVRSRKPGRDRLLHHQDVIAYARERRQQHGASAGTAAQGGAREGHFRGGPAAA